MTGTEQAKSVRPLGRRGAPVQQAILAAALDELAARGIDEASVAGVARRAGVHETSVYRRFETREDLFVQALLASSQQRVPVPDTGSLRGDLVAILELVHASLDDPLGLALLRTSTLAVSGKYERERRRFWTSRMTDFLPVFERAVARGEVSSGVDAPLALEMLVAPVHARAVISGARLDDGFVERVVDLLLGGLVGSST